MSRYTIYLASNDKQLYMAQDFDEAAHHDAGETIREALTLALQHKQGFTVDYDNNTFDAARLTHIYLFDGSKKDLLTVEEAEAIVGAPQQAKSTTYTRTVKGTGETLTIGTAEELGVDAEAGKWATVCEDHGTVANSATRQLAYEARGVDFCEGCRTGAPSSKRPKVDFGVRTQAIAYQEGYQDALAELVESLVEGGDVNFLIDALENKINRPEVVAKLRAYYGDKVA